MKQIRLIPYCCKSVSQSSIFRKDEKKICYFQKMQRLSFSGIGIGDDYNSYSFDGVRKKKWHGPVAEQTEVCINMNY